MEALREGIKKKYLTYHFLDRDRFPEFTYNTNRTNYEPLVKSFEEEFYVARGIARGSTSIHIPSTKTFASIFCDDNYAPGRKIFDTCQSYAEGKSRVATPRNSGKSVATQLATGIIGKMDSRFLLLTALLILVGFAVYTAAIQLRSVPPPSNLVVDRPYPKQIVSRRPLVQGTVSNADTVWIVVRAVGWDRYYVQPPIRVEENGTWRGQVYVGSANKGSVGLTFQIRAFVDPEEKFKVLEDYERYVFNDWPSAGLASNVIEVIRGAEND